MPDAKKGPGDDPRPSDQEASLPPASEDTVPRLLAEGNPTPSPEATRALPDPPPLGDLLEEIDADEQGPLDWQLLPLRTYTTRDGKRRQHPPKGWQWRTGSVKGDLMDDDGHHARGVGLPLGKNGIVDIDLDCLEAQELAERFLRETATFRRKGNTTHYLYRTDRIPHHDKDQPKTRAFQNPNGQKKKTILELRRGRCYTVIPPSVKLDGYAAEWCERPEKKIVDWEDGDEERVENLALAVLIANDMLEGCRHDSALAWAGELAKRGVTEKRAMKVVREACDYRGDEELEDRERCVRDTYKTAKRGEPVSRISDEKTRKTLDDILGHRAKLGARSVNVKQSFDVVVQQMNDVLAADDAPAIFRVGEDGYTTAAGNSNRDRFTLELARKIEFVKPKGGGYEVMPHEPSDRLVRVWASAPDERIPELRGVWSAPLLRPDGSVRTDRGYDSVTKVFCKGWDGPKPGTTKEEAEAAAKRLLKFIHADQWQEDIDKCAWLAHVLTVAARPAIGGNVPVWVYSASNTGAGKTTLARAAGKIGGLCDAQTDPDLKNDQELARRLHAHALKPAIVLDNLHGVLRSANLEGAITSGILPVRVLFAMPIDIPWRAVLSVTSNGAVTGRDWIRRVIPVRLSPVKLDAGREVLNEIKPKHTKDAITIVRAWLLSGEKSKAAPLSSFSEWSRVIAGALVWLGFPDVVAKTREHAEGLASSEDNATEILNEIEALLAETGKKDISSEELLKAKKLRPTLGEVLLEFTDTRSLGQRLGRLADGTRAMVKRKTKGKWVWGVVPMG